MPLAPQLQAYQDAYHRARQEAHDVADALGADAFNWKPSPETWSVGECLAHLNVVAGAYAPVLEEALEGAAPRGEPPFHYGWLARRFIEANRPGGRALRTPRAMRPPEAGAARSALDPEATLTTFDRLTDRMIAAVARGDGLDLAHLRVASPFLRILRLPAGAFLDALGQHALRHVAQARRVTEHPGFPG